MRFTRIGLWLISSLLALTLTGCGDTSPTGGPATTSSTTPAPPTSPTVTTPVASATSVSPSQSTTNAGPSPVSATVSTTSPATSATAGNTQESADWPTYHRDNLRIGYVPNEIDPKQLTQKWNTKLDGAVYAEPLIVGTHVLVATEGNSLYSLNAQTGAVEWQTNIAPPVPRSALPCGNIDPLGITGTPVYDPATGLVFAVAELSGPAHLLVGLDVNSGQIKLRRSADLPGMEPRPHQQRAALALSQGMVYIAYGGLFGDCGNYLGRVVAARTDGQGDLLAFQVPTTREGGIWAASGPAIDSSGRLYVAVGNGEETRGDWDRSDSVLRLSPTLKLEDGFAPKEWQQDNARDADLGSLGPVLLSNGYVLIAGKSGTAYSLKANALGGVGGQVQELKLCSAYGGAASVGNQAFLPCTGGVQAVQVGDDGKLTPGWQAKVNGSPVIGGHTVYSVDQSGTLYALDLETGATRATANIGRTSRFATPTISKGVVYVGTLSGVVAVSLNP